MKTKFYDFEEEMLVQAENKKAALKETGYDQVAKEDIPFIQIVSEQEALNRLSKIWYEDGKKQIGFSEAKRIIDENKNRILIVDANLGQ